MIESHLKNGLNLFLESSYGAAEVELRKAVVSCPTVGHIHSLIAACQLEQGRLHEALAVANEGSRLEPANAYPKLVLSRIHARLGNVEQAEEAIHEAILLNSRDPAYFAEAAEILLVQERWTDAVLQASRGLDLDARDLACINARARALLELGRIHEARRSLQVALRIRPDVPKTHATMGWLLLSEGQPLDALQHFREALELNPNEHLARRGIVQAFKALRAIYYPLMAFCLWMNDSSITRMNKLSCRPALSAVRFLLSVIGIAANQTFNMLFRVNQIGRPSQL